jgi:ubiquinone/menaquinone biosynthesis C-methylase UbiE
MTATDFDKIAKVYSSERVSPWNDLYERPNSVRMLGDVKDKLIVDAGCGGGKHTSDLLKAGAQVEGFDLSDNMLDFARTMLGDRVKFQVASLDAPLPYEDAYFDAALCALAMHYVKDWTQPLNEFARILKPGGTLVISTHHPFMDHQLAGGENYFAHKLIEDRWEKNGEVMHVRYWRRSLADMISAFTDANFTIEKIEEPMPLPETKEKFPDAYEKLTTQPRFIFFKLKRG